MYMMDSYRNQTYEMSSAVIFTNCIKAYEWIDDQTQSRLHSLNFMYSDSGGYFTRQLRKQ